MSDVDTGVEAVGTPARLILSVGERLADMLNVEPSTAAEIVSAQAIKAGVTQPPGASRNGGTQLALGEAVMIFAAAVVALARTNAPRLNAHARELGTIVGLAADEVRVASEFVRRGAANAPPLSPLRALGVYFDPDAGTKILAKALVERLGAKRSRRPIAHVRPTDYEHPDDRAGLAAVRSITGVEYALRKISEMGVEKVEAIENLAGCVRVGSKQFPELHELFLEAVSALGMPTVPELYMKSMGLNAYTVGIERPRVVLSYTLPALFTRDELLFVIGHELGHVRSGHAPFAMLRQVLPQLAEIVGQATLGIGALVGMGMQGALLDWYRKSEMTCDRCGLLVCQKPDAAFSALMKLAGAPTAFYRQMNLEAFIAQADDYDKLDSSVLSKLYKLTNALEQDHPWPAVRARELVRWIHSGDYERFLAGAALPAAPACPGCGAALTNDDVFCSGCGTKVAAR